jgi:hypothetical protein
MRQGLLRCFYIKWKKNPWCGLLNSVYSNNYEIKDITGSSISALYLDNLLKNNVDGKLITQLVDNQDEFSTVVASSNSYIYDTVLHYHLHNISLHWIKRIDWLIDWLIDYLLFYVPLKNIALIWRRHHCRWRAAKFRPMLSAFEQGGIFIVPHQLWHGTSVFPVSFSRLLRHTWGCGWSILTRIFTGD